MQVNIALSCRMLTRLSERPRFGLSQVKIYHDGINFAVSFTAGLTLEICTET